MSPQLGPLFLSGIFSSLLWGAGSVQLYFYYENYANSDSRSMRLYLLLMYVLDTVHQVDLLVSLYTYFVKDFTSILLLERIGRPIVDAVMFSNFVCVLAQIFYLKRIWHLSNRNYVLIVVLALLIVAQFVTGSIYFSEILNLHETTDLMNHATMVTVRILNAIIAATDVSLAFTMAFLLHSQRSGIRQTDSLINRLIMYSVGTGLVTGALGFVAFISAFALPNAFFYLLFDLLLPKLYINSILVLLNVRQKLRGNNVVGSDGGLSVNKARPGFMGKNPAAQNTASPADTVVDMEEVTDRAVRNGSNGNKV
ncbi:hypothetical protein M0805_004685 [Coniferiporia weirii]|nr:hypothetical protein M0805_004685 [Coniferiporia weirii]